MSSERPKNRDKELKMRRAFYERRHGALVFDTCERFNYLLKCVSAALGFKSYKLFEIREYKRKKPTCNVGSYIGSYTSYTDFFDIPIICKNTARYRFVFRLDVLGKSKTFKQFRICEDCYEKLVRGIIELFVIDSLTLFGYNPYVGQEQEWSLDSGFDSPRLVSKMRELSVDIFWRHVLSKYDESKTSLKRREANNFSGFFVGGGTTVAKSR